jgi:hypothetical protein
MVPEGPTGELLLQAVNPSAQTAKAIPTRQQPDLQVLPIIGLVCQGGYSLAPLASPPVSPSELVCHAE